MSHENFDTTAMPDRSGPQVGPKRYFFHAGDGSIERDAEGEVLPDDDAAADIAVTLLAEMLPTRRALLWETGRCSVAVKDEAGRMVALLTTTAIRDPDPRPDAPPRL